MAEKKLMVVVGGHAKEFEKMMSNVRSKLQKTGREMQKIGQGMTTAITLPIMAVGGTAIKAFADFEQAMAGSVAIMGDLSDSMRSDMEAAARDVAKTTRFSATDAAESYYFLASAGMDAAQAIEALPRVAAFAQAGNFDMARATDLLTDAQSALGLAVDDVTQNMENMNRVSDVLVGANTLANASVEQFSEALTNKAGAAARLLEKDVEEAAAVLAVFADQGKKGAAAGESLNIVWRDLQKAAINNAEAFEQYGVAVYDTEGNMRNTADIIEDLENAFAGMSDEQLRATLMTMGFQDKSVSNIQALLGTSDAIRTYEADLRSMSGITQDVADKQLDNLWDQLGLIKDQLIDVAIELGSQLVPIIKDSVLPVIQKFAEWLGKLAEWFGNLSPTMQKVIIAFAGLLAALGPIIFVIGTLMTSFAAMMPLITGIGKLFIGLIGGVKALGGALVFLATNPIGWVILAIGALIAAGVLIYKNWDTIKEKALEIWGAIKEFFAGIWERIKDIFRQWGPWILAALAGPFGIIAKLIYDNWNEIKDFFSNIWESIKEIFTGATSGLFDGIKERFTAVKDWLSDIWEKVKDFFAGIWDSISGVFDMSLSEIWETIKGWFFAYQDFVKNLMGNIEGTISDLWNSAKDKVITAAKAIYDGVKNWFTNLGDSVRGVIRGMVNAVIGLFNNMIGRLNRLSIKIPDWVPFFGGKGFSPNIPTIPTLHSGTDYFIPPGGGREGLALLERGEQVIPRGEGRTITHTGTIRLEGVNDAGQLIAVKEIILDELYKELRG